jgi:hypothetical protein
MVFTRYRVHRQGLWFQARLHDESDGEVMWYGPWRWRRTAAEDDISADSFDRLRRAVEGDDD